MAEIVIMKKPISMQDMIDVFPKHRKHITDELIESLDVIQRDPLLAGDFLDNLKTYRELLTDSSEMGVKNFIDQVRFVTHKLGGYSILESYILSNPDDDFVQARKMDEAGTPGYKELMAAATRIASKASCKAMLAKAQLPLYVIHSQSMHEAVTVLADQMVNAPRAQDKISAANFLLTHVKPPDEVIIHDNTTKSEVERNLVATINMQLGEMIAQQKKEIALGRPFEESQSMYINLNEEMHDHEGDANGV